MAAKQINTQGRRTLIVGLGQTGLSCARFLGRLGIDFDIADSREQPPVLASFIEEFPQVSARLGRFDPTLFEQAEELILSPGVSADAPAVVAAAAAGVPVIGDIELFARYAVSPVVAVTGSNGKSTVTALVGEMARDQARQVLLGGNIGIPALDLLAKEAPDFYVLELSSFQLETTRSLDAAAAVVLNVSADHLDRHSNMESYLSAKRRVYHGHGVMVINRDDPGVAGMDEGNRRVIRFGLGVPHAGEFGVIRRDDESWLAWGRDALMPCTELRLPGRHNLANALAALALGQAVHLELDGMLQTLRRFSGLPHRCRWVARTDGVDWYNDSKATNVGAALAAIEGLEPQGKLVLIAGGDGKRADFRPLRTAVRERVRALVLIGRDAPRIAQAVDGLVSVNYAVDMAQAVESARRVAQAGDAVLLSPACASRDMFRDYQERGEVFVAAVTGGETD